MPKATRYVQEGSAERKRKSKWQRQHKPLTKVIPLKSKMDVAAIAAAIRARGDQT